jgi:deoxyribodipyrimidine photo-lyase
VTVSVVWFRRDLRLHDHPALTAAQADGDRIAPLFVLDERLQAGRFRSENRLWFMRGSVSALATALEVRGAPLSVVRGDPSEVVPAFAVAVGAGRVAASRDYTPYGRGRDDRVAAALGRRGIEWTTLPGLLIHEPEDVATANGRPFRQFGPFHRAWLELPQRDIVAAPDAIAGVGALHGRRVENLLEAITPTADPALLPAPGEDAARERLARWVASRALDRYATDRDRLDLEGTSRLGQDLRWGLISASAVEERCAGPGEGRRRFRSELAWRDFYAHLLWHDPRLGRTSFRPSLDRVAWEHDARVIDAWRTGQTGYPVVDAAMRQLTTSGWMHNRARMIAASFLTKSLGVDWRVGEQYFMEHLIDGDPASNNGGWQWAASTGTDAQPWFRIFNPTLQAIRHDPDGAYVRRWLPELAGLPREVIHAPPPGAYVAPIVDLREARARALTAYRAAPGLADPDPGHARGAEGTGCRSNRTR